MNNRHNKNESLYLLNNENLDTNIQKIYTKFKSSTTPNDLYNLIDKIDNTISTIDLNLDNYITIHKQKLQQDITNIESLRTSKLSSTITNSSQLSEFFTNTDELGHNLTYKIKSLDQEIGNVNETLTYVENIQLLKNNINQINYAIDHQQWDSAAHCIHTINTKIPQSLIQGEYASVVIPSTDIPELPRVCIDNWTKKLVEVFKNQFNEAAKERNVEKLTKFFQLFPLIKQEEVGLNCYSKFICEVINESSKNLTQTVNNISASDLKPGIFATVSMQLFENVSMMLSQHGPLIKRYYSSTYPEALTFVVNKIQREIDLQIGIIADTFYDARRLDKIFQDIRLYNFPILTQRTSEMQEHYSQDHNNQDEIVDSKATDDLLPIQTIGDLISELSSILQNWSLYCKFITAKYFNDSNQTDELHVPDIINKSNFTKKINEKLLPSFEKLYNFYYRRSLEKSITIEELQPLDTYLKFSTKSKSPDQTPVSSVIEDLTLILNTTLRNVIKSGFPISVKNFIIESFKILQQDLINGFFIKNLNDNRPKYNQSLNFASDEATSSHLTNPKNSRGGTPEPHGSSIHNSNSNGHGGFFKGASSAFGSVVSGSGAIVGSLQSSTTANSPKLINFIIYLNSIGVSQDYFVKVIQNIIGQDGTTNNYVNSNFPFGKDSEKIKLILNQDFLDPFTSISNKILNESLINLYNQSIKQKLMILVNEFILESNESNYIIYSSNQINDPSVLIKFKSNWSLLTKPYLQVLHKSIWLKLLRLIIVNLVNLVERKLHSTLKNFKINEMGSIKLEKDLSFIINEVCEDNYHLREKFLKLTQIVLLIGMDDDEYEESNQPVISKFEKDENGEVDDVDEDDEEEIGGINWILTPQERDQIRNYRV
ncbi:COG4 [Candida jiufengensis]|uniref:COG4 n=1 Tax=Candida jiufengensis TaxID=497108 RepID=UPI0022249D2C|nr:COG4 [Candida jiufengensis]KAI5951904.1 COG4 [Candida jiufengensis]